MDRELALLISVTEEVIPSTECNAEVAGSRYELDTSEARIVGCSESRKLKSEDAATGWELSVAELAGVDTPCDNKLIPYATLDDRAIPGDGTSLCVSDTCRTEELGLATDVIEPAFVLTCTDISLSDNAGDDAVDTDKFAVDDNLAVSFTSGVGMEVATEDPTLRVEGDGNMEDVDILALSVTVIVLGRSVSVANTPVELWLTRTCGYMEYVSESVDSAINLIEDSNDGDEVTMLDIENSVPVVCSTEEVLSELSTEYVLSLGLMLLV